MWVSGFAFVVAMAACGGGSGRDTGDSDAVRGTVHGMPVGVQDAISASITQTVQGLIIHGAAIAMASTPNLCSDATDLTAHPNETFVFLTLFDVNGTTFTTPAGPGTYTVYQSGVPPTKAAGLNVLALDATCNSIATSSANATSGTVNVTTVSGNAFDGTFDVALDSGDHITGSFHPQECPALEQLFNSPTAGPCT